MDFSTAEKLKAILEVVVIKIGRGRKGKWQLNPEWKIGLTKFMMEGIMLINRLGQPNSKQYKPK